MIAPYDIFTCNDGGYRWFGTAHSLADTIQAIKKRGAEKPAMFAVYCQETAETTYFKVENSQVTRLQRS